MYSCLSTWQHPPDEYAISQAIDRGTIRFDATAAHICVQVLESLACSEFEPAYRYRETYCESPLRGTLGNGVTCHTDRECVSTWCVTDASTPGVGTCTPRVPDGGTCESTGAEPDGCELPDGCQSGTCGIGMLPGTVCSSDWQCVDHWCKGAGFLTSGHCIKACDGK
jgi:hypothetical protein